MTTNTVLRELRPDTEYKVTLVPIYTEVEGKRMTENGKTSEFRSQRSSRGHIWPGIEKAPMFTSGLRVRITLTDQ